MDPNDLGITLIHEHLFFDLSCYYHRPRDPKGKKLTNQSIKLSNLGWIRQNSMNSIPNIRLHEDKITVAEVKRFREFGGQSVVDATSVGIGRNPLGLAKVSARTGVNIIAGSGYYVHPSHPKDMDTRTIEDLRKEIVSDIAEGIDGTGLRAGLIGEIGTSWPLHPNEEKSVRAAARAHNDLGAPVSIHPGQHPESPMQIIDVLREEGVDPHRVVMSHIENRYREKLELYQKLADTGCNLGFDTFGRDQFFASAGRHHPSDDLRIDMISALVRSGYSGHIMVAQDCCFRSDLTKYGGHGYGHILENILPRLRNKGVSDHDIHQILVENPKRFLAFQ